MFHPVGYFNVEYAYLWCRFVVGGGFEHVVNLLQLERLEIDGFWEAFEDLPPEIAALDADTTGSLQRKLGYLRDRFQDTADPLL